MARLALKCLIVFALMSGGLLAAERESVANLRKRAEQGSADAQYLLGNLYTTGDGVPQDKVEAAKWCRKAAEQGNAEAQVSLGFLYLLGGEGVPQDNAEGVKWYRKAGEQGNAFAQASLAKFYYDGKFVQKDFTEAARWYLKAAEQGVESAQTKLGSMYALGEGVPKDGAEAAKWFRKAADQGDAVAQRRLGLMYAQGEGVPKDNAEAAQWYRKAADQGDADAQCSLGYVYFLGYGVPRDRTEAAKWFRKAADQGIAQAQYSLGKMYANGEGVTKDRIEAREWFQKAAAQGHKAAATAIERSNEEENSERAERHNAKALELQRTEALQGNVDAQVSLGFRFAKGDGVGENHVEAAKWFLKAARQGNTTAQVKLGLMYDFGDGVPKDEVEGLAWTYIAAASGGPALGQLVFLESRVGREAALMAQQRAREIQREIDAARDTPSVPTPKSSGIQIGSTSETPRGSGSGAIVSTEGCVLTAAHVVAGANSVKIITAQGMKTASVLRIDEGNDLAVLKLAPGNYVALPIASSRKMRLGQAVATIGFPNVEIQGFSPKVTRGEISSLNGIGDDPRAWQISVPVQTGNSGGPLLDENGNLVGVVVSKLGLKAAAATGDLPQNVNFAVKGAYALALLEPYLGSDVAEPNQSASKPQFEDMVAKAQQSVVLILVY